MKIIYFILLCFICPQLFGQTFYPYSKEAFTKLNDLIVNEYADINYHKELFTKYSDLYKNPKPTYDELEGDDDKKHFVASRPTFTWINDESRIPCNIINYIKESKDYLYERYKTLREKALVQINAIMEADSTNLESRSVEYEKTLQEIKSILNLVEKAYPKEFYELDRVATYFFSLSEEFKDLMNDPSYRPSGDIKITKMKISNGPWIPIHGEIKGHMNFVTNAEVIENYVLSEDFAYESQYAIQLQRELSPLEACLSDLKFEMIGHTGKVKKEPPPRFEPILGRPIPLPIYPKPEPWPWGPAEDPPRPFPICNPAFCDLMPPRF